MIDSLAGNNLYSTGGMAPGKRKIALIIAIVILAAGLAAGIWYIINKLTATDSADSGKVVEQSEQYAAFVKQASVKFQAEAVRDADYDGLSNDEEQKLGTDPDMADTDKDGLKDWTEIKIYATDPLKADTDGDGVKDGAEVLRGSDPKVKNKK